MSWPGYDPFYQHNTVDNNGRRSFYGINGIPAWKMDGYLNPNAGTVNALYASESAIPTPVTLTIVGAYDDVTGYVQYTVTASTNETLPTGSYRIFVALTETDIYFQGSNGVLWHPDVMRDCFPTHAGTDVTFSGGFPQVATVSGDFTLNSIYNWNNCRLVAWVQDVTGQKKVQQAVAAFVSGLDLTDAPAAPARAMALGANYPNPFNPSTTIPVSVERTSAARLDIIAPDGRLVRTLHEGELPAGTREFSWDGTAANGQGVASGVYLVRLHSADGLQSRHLVLMK
ncbi:Omp28-related outer membrane protein [bacterium]|nr:Omp28-related outer membrane protein [bacterium]